MPCSGAHSAPGPPFPGPPGGPCTGWPTAPGAPPQARRAHPSSFLSPSPGQLLPALKPGQSFPRSHRVWHGHRGMRGVCLESHPRGGGAHCASALSTAQGEACSWYAWVCLGHAWGMPRVCLGYPGGSTPVESLTVSSALSVVQAKACPGGLPPGNGRGGTCPESAGMPQAHQARGAVSNNTTAVTLGRPQGPRSPQRPRATASHRHVPVCPCPAHSAWE